LRTGLSTDLTDLGRWSLATEAGHTYTKAWLPYAGRAVIADEQPTPPGLMPQTAEAVQAMTKCH
jgi:hypothetical protein